MTARRIRSFLETLGLLSRGEFAEKGEATGLPCFEGAPEA